MAFYTVCLKPDSSSGEDSVCSSVVRNRLSWRTARVLLYCLVLDEVMLRFGSSGVRVLIGRFFSCIVTGSIFNNIGYGSSSRTDSRVGTFEIGVCPIQEGYSSSVVSVELNGMLSDAGCT